MGGGSYGYTFKMLTFARLSLPIAALVRNPLVQHVKPSFLRARRMQMSSVSGICTFLTGNDMYEEGSGALEVLSFAREEVHLYMIETYWFSPVHANSSATI